MVKRSIWMVLTGAALAVGLGACATAPETPFDPATCFDRDFSIYFEDRSTTLDREAREVIDAVSTSVRGCTIASVRIIGQAEPREGGDEVSIRRAEVMAEYLELQVGWPRSRFELLATGERGALTDEGLVRPMRSRARIVVHATAPDA